MSAPNLNTLWAQQLMAALFRAGVSEVCITPGSRSTPLTYATHKHQGLRPHVHLDERSAAFYALGLAKATQRPVALICTSGTAGANYLPAVIEASLSGVPLILLTADRPPALRDSGASQTIDQVHLFGSHVRHYAELQLPEADPVAVRRLHATAVQALGLAMRSPMGPVHLNVPFADPLAPLPANENAIAALESAMAAFATHTVPGRMQADEQALKALAAQMLQAERGLIVAGPDATRNPARLLELARRTGFPVLADVASGLRFAEPLDGALCCAHAEAFLRAESPGDWQPDLVLRLGGLPTAATLNTYLARCLPYTVMLQEDLQRRDPDALIDLRIVGEVDDSVQRLTAAMPDEAKRTPWQRQFQQAEETAARAMAEAVDKPLEAFSVRSALEAMPDTCAVFLSSSMSIRYAEVLASCQKPGMQVYVSRGANGIDGIISTAIGVCVGSQLPTLLITGDLAFLHDIGGLYGVRHLEQSFAILALNNDGGGIFSHLPISQFPEVFEPYFGTPHGLPLAPAAELYDLNHVQAASPEQVAALVMLAMQNLMPCLIEVPSDRNLEATAYKTLLRQAAIAVDEAFAVTGATP